MLVLRLCLRHYPQAKRSSVVCSPAELRLKYSADALLCFNFFKRRIPHARLLVLQIIQICHSIAGASQQLLRSNEAYLLLGCCQGAELRPIKIEDYQTVGFEANGSGGGFVVSAVFNVDAFY